ncbi:hypothetical protein A2533_02905 [Candidatus Falkowbacteria bacterium RIFOXYD2_FULL_35_9]|uniref:Uncharacterized protein n=1 Tax=Candidatus Falkowbacteria bacterium RIFOXYC2_FULL_36_12 TaxID=1798002 RepID=A0A1F5SYT6_9BACT|nr:MAG: hypothetical protein A2478_05035 [Candidatus Falkowbacteria bacterium RIFOXYC2_FULL_36_12]OGF33773.1 MAG: hypothetical protein A2223_00155 [Candidatus Falkowbacteria bacterium RIFOXYA2_FULL_35_8]OGF46305.1 MAG: hypothetical protein A2533_02905 [Candidatus Falkowbacteria bacterium RIFOXYD2_FULL_35_9]
MSTVEQIKELLYSAKSDVFMKSEFEYLYRETIDFIINKYQEFSKTIEDTTALENMLPCLAFDNFKIEKKTSSEQQLENSVSDIIRNEKSEMAELTLIKYAKDEENFLTKLILFQQSSLSFNQIEEKIKLMTLEQKEKLINLYFDTTKDKNVFNFFHYNFQMTCTIPILEKIKPILANKLLVQKLEICNGYYTPPKILHSGYHGDYILIMKKAIDAYKKMLPTLSTQAFYIVPLAFMQKILFTVKVVDSSLIQLPFKQQLWQKIKEVNPTIYEQINKLITIGEE